MQNSSYEVNTISFYKISKEGNFDPLIKRTEQFETPDLQNIHHKLHTGDIVRILAYLEC